MSLPPTQYNASSIESREGLMAMRGTPTLFLPDLEHGGISHAALEVISNSNDELTAHPLGAAQLTVMLCRDIARQTFQWVVKDTGRGIPYEKNSKGESTLVICLTKPHTSGKFNQDNYDISAGQFGVGLKATAATSLVLRCLSSVQNATASLTVRQGRHADEPLVALGANAETGTITVWEPDPEIFAGVDTYMDVGYQTVVSLLRQLVFFRYRNIVFKISDDPIDPAWWDNEDVLASRDYINRRIDEAPVIWDAKSNDPIEWIKSYWNLHRSFTWQRQLEMTAQEKDAYAHAEDPKLHRLRDVIIKLFYIKGDRTGGTFALVNTVPIPDRNSDHIAVVSKELKQAMSHLLGTEAKKKFFLNSYNLSLFYAISVDYKGAKFSNAQKTAFKEVDFRVLYAELMKRWFNHTPAGQEVVSSLYELLKDDIETRYMDSLGEKTQVRDTSRIWTRLKHYKNFIDAESTDRSSCELILLEGKSTGGGVDYDTEHQAIYFMQGKPCNALRGTNGDRYAIIDRISKHSILSDIMKLINFDPRRPDLSQLYFGRVGIACDADKRHHESLSTLTETLGVKPLELLGTLHGVNQQRSLG